MVDLSALSNLKVLVVGLAREGTALATYLTKHGITVTVTDIKSAEKLGAAIAPLEKIGVPLVLGEHPLSLLDWADILFVSPGVPLEIPFLQEAQTRKIPLSTESRLFCHLCPAPILGITGSSGKSTTTTLLGKIMEASGRKTWVGGNIGVPLISVVDEIAPTDVVVMELSSFQLEYFQASLNKNVNGGALAPLLAGWSPPIGAILNITPNHLDRHPSMRSYVRAKRAIIEAQPPEGIIIMSLDNDVTRTIGNQFSSKVRWFSVKEEKKNGAFLFNEQLLLLDAVGTRYRIVSQHEVKLRGLHNVSNMLAACLIAREAGASLESMRTVLTTFTGLPHRLEFVRECNQVRYYDDSISTTPERLSIALRSFDEPIILLAGGRDKNLPWEEATHLMGHKTKQIILFGEAKNMIADVLSRHKISNFQVRADLTEAVQLATQLASPGEVVLLSPGCASFDAFRDFVDRGERFKELVGRLD